MPRQILLVLGVAALLFGVFLTVRKSGGGGLSGMAPEISATEWLNTSTPHTLASLSDKIVVVEFWATWCPPCRQSIPHLNELHAKYKDKGVVILGLTDEARAKVEPFAKQLNMAYPVGLGSRSANAYKVEGIPAAFVVAPGGKIVWAGHPMMGLDKAIEKAITEK